MATQKDQPITQVIREQFSRLVKRQEGLYLHAVTVAFLIGAMLYFAVPYEPRSSITFFPIALMGAIWAAVHKNRQAVRILGVGVAVLLGLGAAQFQTSHNDITLLEKDLSTQPIEGTIIGFEPTENGWRVLIKDVNYQEASRYERPDRLRVTVRHNSFEPHIGDRIQLKGSVMAPSQPLLPNSFNFRRHAFYQKIGGYGFAVTTPEVIERGSPSWWRDSVALYRKILTDAINSELPNDWRGVVLALVTGQKAAIPDGQMESIRRAGLAHLLAISGLHVGLVAGLLFFTIRFCFALVPYFALHYPIKKWSAALTLILTFGYMLLVGASVSTQRAMIMTALVLIAVMMERVALTLRTVAVAALLIVAVAPSSIIHPGFQMSFAAVIALISFYEATQPWWSQQYRGAGFIKRLWIAVMGIIVTTVIATVAVVPFAAYHFQQISLLGVLANAIAMPLMSLVIMPLVLLTLIVGWAPALVYWPLYGLQYSVSFLLLIAGKVSSLPRAVMTVPVFGGGTLLFAVAGFLMITLLKGRVAKSLGVLPYLAAVAIVLTSNAPDILIPADRSFIGYVEGDRLYLSQKGESFTRDLVKRYVGADQVLEMQDILNCERNSCVVERGDKHIAIPLTTEEAIKDCHYADIVISTSVIPRECEADRAIDLFDVLRRGGAVGYLNSDGRLNFKWVKQSDRIWDKR